MKPTLASSYVDIYMAISRAKCENIYSCPGTPINKGKQISTHGDAFTNIKIEVPGKMDCHTYMYM